MLDGGALQLEMKGYEGRDHEDLHHVRRRVLALTAVATSCTTVAGETAGSGRVYLVGVAGGG